VGKYLALLREKFPADFVNDTAVNGKDLRVIPAKAAQVDSEIVCAAVIDTERAARDRAGRRGYDFEPTAPGHQDFIESIYRAFQRTISLVNDLHITRGRLGDAQRIFGIYAGVFDKCFEAREWLALLAAFDRLLKELRDLSS